MHRGITDFLLARIADDMRAAVAASPVSEGWDALAGDVDLLHGSATGLVARYGPARVLVECHAKRRILGLHYSIDAGRPPTLPAVPSGGVSIRSGPGGCAECGIEWPCDTVRALALPYADHPDYRDLWLAR